MTNAQHQEESQPATVSDAIREHIWAVGSKYPDLAWISSPYDTWERNPHYVGLPVTGHPEDEDHGEIVDVQPEPRSPFNPDDDEIPF